MTEPMADEARRQMRRFAERCGGGEGPCQSCRFLLRALDEIDRLTTPGVVWNATETWPRVVWNATETR